jgi:hypothetical protein
VDDTCQSRQPFDAERSTPSTFDFDVEGTVLFDGQFGPFPTQCFGTEFMLVNGADSVEVFVFTLRGSGAR